MPKYEVQFSLTGEHTVTVEAEDREKAEEVAREKLDLGFEPDWVELDEVDDIREVD